MKKAESGFMRVLKTGLGILAVAVVISGIFLYFTNRMDPIKYRFNPESDYVYTFHRDLFAIKGEGEPQKKVTIFQDGFHPLCPFGCLVDATGPDLTERVVHSPVGETSDEEAGYVFLGSDDGLVITFHMDKGDKVEGRFPYLNRVILQLKDDSKAGQIRILADSYPFSTGGSSPQAVNKDVTEFDYAEDFGDYLVFKSPQPSFVRRIKIAPKDGVSDKVGLKWVNAYLSRSAFLSAASRVERELASGEGGREKSEGPSLGERIDSLEPLDPYSPKTELLRAKLYQSKGEFQAALSQVEKGIDAANRYSQFLNNEVKLVDLYKLRAHVARDLGEWEMAIDSMEEGAPEVDHGFLVDVYQSKYLDSGDRDDLDRAVRQAFLHFKGTPRLTLETINSFAEKGLLEEATHGLDRVLNEGDEGKFTLTTGEAVSPFIGFMAKSLFNYWLEREGSLPEALEYAKESSRVADDREKSALAAAVLSLIYKESGQPEEAKSYEETAVDYFSGYASLYDDWQSALEGREN